MVLGKEFSMKPPKRELLGGVRFAGNFRRREGKSEAVAMAGEII
jgi:hypothetical protein